MIVRTRVKVCGITELADAMAAVKMGVDGLGFIFAAGSPRKIEPEKARGIIASLPPFVEAIGVFVDETATAVNEISKFCGLTIVQLHGGESPAYCRSITSRVVKSFSLRPDGAGSEPSPDYESYRGLIAGYLLDTYHAGLAGGTGLAFDWDLVSKSRPPGPVILAGGLHPDNVGRAIAAVRPFAVDVNSGVESAPGRKDPARLARLLAEVVRADTLAINR
jgi:phosphoribosylanthranilate isomerase